MAELYYTPCWTYLREGFEQGSRALNAIAEFLTSANPKPISRVNLERCLTKKDGMLYVKGNAQLAFPSGALWDIIDWMQGSGHALKIVGQPRPSSYTVPQGFFDYGTWSLRDVDQVPAVRAMIAAGRGILEAAPGFGKTEVVIALADFYAERLSRQLGETFTVLILVDREALFTQTVERFKQRLPNMRLGRISPQCFEPEQVTVAMAQTLISRMKSDDPRVDPYVDSVSVVIADDCHKFGDGEPWDLIMQLPASHRYGLTATAMRYDRLRNLRLSGAFGPVVHAETHQSQAELGHIADTVALFQTVRHVSRYDCLGTSHETYHRYYSECIIENEARNRMGVTMAAEALLYDFQTLMVVEQRVHGEILQRIAQERGLQPPLLDGRMANVDAAVRDIREGRTPLAVVTPVFDYGVDLPDLGALVMMGAGQTPVGLVNRHGRGLRKKSDGRSFFLYHDFRDIGSGPVERHSVARQHFIRQLHNSTVLYDVSLRDVFMKAGIPPAK